MKSLFFVEFRSQDEISVCVTNEYLLSELLSRTARHTHLNRNDTIDREKEAQMHTNKFRGREIMLRDLHC